jgi:hypothetical protein
MGGPVPNYRVYFNRKNEAPQVWSIDEGDQSSEQNVINWKTHRCDSDSHYDPTIPDRDPDHPTAWVEVIHAILRMEHGVAHFFHDPDWRVPPLETPDQREERMERDTARRLNELP